MRAEQIEERDKMFNKIFGNQSDIEVKVRKKAKLKQDLSNSVRRSERLQTKKDQEIISCPFCCKYFKEVSSDLENHFVSHL